MGTVAIHASGVGKQFRIPLAGKPRYRTLRDQVADTLRAPFRARKLSGDASSITHYSEISTRRGKATFWAIQDISFSVDQGEVVGIIGRNGAGKSTLLKILTRIMDPTEGVIDIWGRVGSLLEVGTGFHKELTGRENVYLNGAILGMKKTEIDRKFDEIIDFAEVEKFIDTPVKFYSSGMSVRLAFAVAAHLEPEILLVDEVLAVGDASFQKKCLNKMEDVGKQGRTVLFVSHHMPSITRLCERVILLESGRMVDDGAAQKVVGSYLRTTLAVSPRKEWKNIGKAPGNEIVRLTSVQVKSETGQFSDAIPIHLPVCIEMEYQVLLPGYAIYPGFTLHNEEGLWLFSSIDTDLKWRGKHRPPGVYRSTSWIPGNFLREGTMSLGVSFRTEVPRILHFYERDAAAFQIIELPDSGLTARVDYVGDLPGVVRPLLRWETQHI